jgi:hypothetical protein
MIRQKINGRNALWNPPERSVRKKISALPWHVRFVARTFYRNLAPKPQPSVLTGSAPRRNSRPAARRQRQTLGCSRRNRHHVQHLSAAYRPGQRRLAAWRGRNRQGDALYGGYLRLIQAACASPAGEGRQPWLPPAGGGLRSARWAEAGRAARLPAEQAGKGRVQTPSADRPAVRSARSCAKQRSAPAVASAPSARVGQAQPGAKVQRERCTRHIKPRQLHGGNPPLTASSQQYQLARGLDMQQIAVRPSSISRARTRWPAKPGQAARLYLTAGRTARGAWAVRRWPSPVSSE